MRKAEELDKVNSKAPSHCGLVHNWDYLARLLTISLIKSEG